MISKSCCIAIAATLTLPTSSHAASVDPYAKVYDVLIETTRDDCRSAGIWRSKSIIDTLPVNPHQRADLTAQAQGRCISEGYSIAELIYGNLHSGQMSMSSVKFCATRVDSPSQQFAGDTISMRFLSCMQTK